jgi:Flp pilus assembly pilin Flp
VRRRLELGSESGQTIPEYGLIVGGMAVLLIVAIFFAGGKVNGALHHAAPAAPGTLRPPSSVTCEPSYSGACIPAPPPALDCGELRAMGITGDIEVVGSDPLGLDPDGDGIACD